MKELKDLIDEIINRDDLVVLPPEPKKETLKEVIEGNRGWFETIKIAGETTTASSFTDVTWQDIEDALITSSTSSYRIQTATIKYETVYEETEQERINRETALESKEIINFIKNKKMNYANRGKRNNMERNIVKTRSLPRNRHRMVAK